MKVQMNMSIEEEVKAEFQATADRNGMGLNEFLKAALRAFQTLTPAGQRDAILDRDNVTPQPTTPAE